MTHLASLPSVTGELLDGRYRLQGQVGAGGMATVYRALDESLGRTVAVKLFRPGTAEAADVSRKAFETRVLASLNHHALVTLFDARIDSNDGAYLVMEFIAGPTLSQRIAESPVAPEAVAAMALDLAEALHVVHEANVVHRDIKPSNVLLRPMTGTSVAFRTKLADFGIAYLIDSTRVTTPGTVMGTAAYLSPEQVRGAAPATPTDVYSLGLVLLEALTGARAFPQTSTHESLVVRLNQSPAIPGALGYPWKSLLTAMTVPRPEDRPTALEVATAVRAMTSSAATSALPPTAPVTRATLPLLHASSVQPQTTVSQESDPTAKIDVPQAAVVGALAPLSDHPMSLTAVQETARTLQFEIPRTSPRAAEAAGRPQRLGRLWLALSAVLILAAATGILIWVLLNAHGATAQPQLPPLPEPLSSHLDKLLKEVTP